MEGGRPGLAGEWPHYTHLTSAGQPWPGIIPRRCGPRRTRSPVNKECHAHATPRRLHRPGHRRLRRHRQRRGGGPARQRPPRSGDRRQPRRSPAPGSTGRCPGPGPHHRGGWRGPRRRPGRHPVHLVFNAIGMLHDEQLGIGPEKKLDDLDAGAMARLYHVNAITPALLLKALQPSLKGRHPALFASLSARVGSIGDNRLGGWYAYRASKAAHNMLMKTAAVEMRRLNPRPRSPACTPAPRIPRSRRPFRPGCPTASCSPRPSWPSGCWRYSMPARPRRAASSSTGPASGWHGDAAGIRAELPLITLVARQNPSPEDPHDAF